MPIYELACKECGHQYERIVSFSSTVLPACPACSSVEVTRLLSQPAIHFKGSGWYITDSKKEDEKKKAAAQKKEAQKTDSNGSGPEKSAESESKSEAKSETKAESNTSSTGEKSAAKEKS
ncbi:MAG: zinc ribbon domain-containing protein [Caldilineaceae bacterium SB0670_bin_27]|uniref:Zinc ribbon domain-containing protein n=1 Tax=Caldilineaceae bacterium SB0664_bin_27 TaxID=2605260 RepID=A0A6B0YUN8_9CHLR|nr:zinc ribbon domain-containing protein [Caldilineaceae bacterium]MDE0338153.1 zinc ribbon domain-containing protein [Caldilineaceae bacterium]MXY93168.1 zinc ribbon domain-containing protein [Caldilineaceae bacterium SB0664_bin_27]MYJ78195.1 zinc ribbon domain-containing protein [Caldilineaceae bacterium SB0670_bin_27]